MEKTVKKEIGARLRYKREQSGYSREKLSPRFIANIEFGDSTFSLDSLMTVCRVLSCSCDYLLFGNSVDSSAWSDVTSKLENLDTHYKEPVDKLIQSVVEIISMAESLP